MEDLTLSGSTYYPDNWVLLEIRLPNAETSYRVLGGWDKNAQWDFWRLNSGITHKTEDNINYYFTGYSNSVYVCPKGTNFISTATKDTLNSLKNKLQDNIKLIKPSDLKLNK